MLTSESQTPNLPRLLFLIVLIILVSYSNSFNSSWQFDDSPNILNNHRIQLEQFTWKNLWQTGFAKPGHGGLYRPVACVSLALNWYIGGQNIFGYHIVNFLIHCATSLILFFLIRLLFMTPRLKGQYSQSQIEFMAGLTVLLWSLNPIQIQAVTYIIQRMTSLAAMFSLLTLFFFLKGKLALTRGRRSTFWALALASYLMAIFSKENAVLVLISLPILELIFFRIDVSSGLIRKRFYLFFGCGLIILALSLILHPNLFKSIINGYDGRPFTMVQRILTEPRILIFYISQIFFPFPERFSIGHDISLSTSLFDPMSTFGAICLNFGIICLALGVLKRHPVFCFAILFYYLNHMVESSFIGLELIFEHRNYLPSAFLFLPFSQFFVFLLNKFRSRKMIISMIWVVLGSLVISYGCATYERNKKWYTEESLWLDALVKNNESYRPYARLAISLGWGENPTEAKYRKALELMQISLGKTMPHVTKAKSDQFGNMASLYVKLEEYQQAIAYFEKALALYPKDATNRYNLTKTLIKTGEFPRAKTEIKILLDQGNVQEDFFKMLGHILLWTKEPELALPAFQTALKYAPMRSDILLGIGKCFSQLGNFDRAEWFYSLAHNRNRSGIVYLCRIENALLSGRKDKAHNLFMELIKQISVEKLISPLIAPPAIRYQEVPLKKELLMPFIRSELNLLINHITS